MSPMPRFVGKRVPGSSSPALTESDASVIPIPARNGPGGFRDSLHRVHEWVRHPRHIVEVASLLVILVAGITLRLHFANFLDPFEDGYQNWWISANLASTGQYWDRHSMMTQGNWLPLYHFFQAGVLDISGLRSMEALKAANIAISSLTTAIVFLIARKRGPIVALAATSFYSLNLISIAVSGWATPETMASFFALLGYAMLFEFKSPPKGRFWIAALVLCLAVTVRYEAWLIIGLLLIFSTAIKDPFGNNRKILISTVPAILFMVGYFAYATQWGFLPSIVVNQTSTDLRYQISVGTQPSPTLILSRWWNGYFGYFPLVLPFGAGYAFLRFRREFGAWIVLSLWGFVIFYALMLFGNPSFRYVLITIPFLSIFAAFAIADLARFVVRPGRKPSTGGTHRTLVVTIAGVFLLAGTLLPSVVGSWGPGYLTSSAMEPLRRAGEYVSSLQLPDGKILVCESPIAAYFSGYSPDRILGSRWLPTNRSAALSLLKTTTAYIVYMGVPYYSLRLLFPELQNGTTTPDFEFLFDAGGIQSGTHAVFVYRIRP
jgi:hypothetical protein